MTTPTRRDVLKHARWTSNRQRTIYGLYAREKDGGMLLATVTELPRYYAWEAGGRSSLHETRYGAQRAARKALREVGDATNSEAS